MVPCRPVLLDGHKGLDATEYVSLHNVDAQEDLQTCRILTKSFAHTIARWPVECF